MTLTVAGLLLLSGEKSCDNILCSSYDLKYPIDYFGDTSLFFTYQSILIFFQLCVSKTNEL